MDLGGSWIVTGWPAAQGRCTSEGENLGCLAMKHRVIQWATGNVGAAALPAIIRHPDLELVGVIVHSADKVGRDAGDLCGLPATGVVATDDVDTALALDADVVSYMATGDLRPDDAVADMCRALESGKNVVSTSVVSLVYPPSYDPRLRALLEDACQKGGTSAFTNGIDPGFANELLPILLTGFTERVDAVRVQEILNYDTYDQGEVLFETMGFGKPLDAEPLLLLPGSLTLGWGGVVHMIAAALDVDLDEICEVHERLPATETFTIASGVVEEGTTAALHFQVIGVVDGRDAIIVEHWTRLRDDQAPDWPQPPRGGGYVITVDGSPSLRCELTLEGEDGDHNTGGVLATAMRVLNAIPAVVEADPGLLSSLDLPLIPGRHLMR